MPKNKAVSIHIGVGELSGSYDSKHFGPMPSATQDAEDLRDALPSYFNKTLLNNSSEITVDNITKCLENFALGENKLNSGDLLVVTYAGHGGKIVYHDDNEEECKDETWCLYDSQLLDDELEVLLSNFDEGVRILLISDSCHSGGILDFLKFEIPLDKRIALIEDEFNPQVFEKFILKKNGFDYIEIDSAEEIILRKSLDILGKYLKTTNFSSEIEKNSEHSDLLTDLLASSNKIRTLPREILKKEWQNNLLLSEKKSLPSYSDRKKIAKGKLQKKLKENYINGYRGVINASVITLSACQSNENAELTGTKANGLFTKNLLNIWNDGLFQGDYLSFHEEIWKKIRAIQIPGYYRTGIPNSLLDKEKPFTL